jgi:peptide/nickel transport system substrate-binding protein
MGHLNAPSRRRPGRLLAALVISAGLVGAACGSDDSSSKDTTATTVAGSETTAGGGDTTVSAAPATTAPPPTTAAEEVPVPGGKLVFAIEADTSSPWRPAEMVCAIACHQVIRNIYDSLTLPNDQGGWSPYLASAVTPNDDFTVWKITAREGVTFHDGTPFDGAAIVENMTRAKEGVLTGNIFRAIDSIALDPDDPMTAVVTTSTSWAAFPFSIMGQAGYQASPTWLAASDTDDTLKSKPVGTGPFVYENYSPNEVFSMTKNPDYWNAPYPYLDAIEFRPIADALNRRDALKSGTVDIIHTTNAETIVDNTASGEFGQTIIENNAETGFTLLHVSQEGSPLTDVRVRCALAYATDEQLLIDTIGAGLNQIAFGPFSPTMVGYLEHTGFPETQDMAKAQELIAAYKAEFPGPLTLSLATTQDQTNLTIAQQQQQWWTEAGIDEVTIDQIDQGSYIVTALLGNFQVFQWRNNGGFDLDMQYHWWHSSAAPPVGELALNFGRIRDPQLDALLDENRASADPARKKEIAEEVNKLFGTQCYNLWGSYTKWDIIYKQGVHGPVTFALPDGGNAVFGAGIAGTFYPMTLWVEQ